MIILPDTLLLSAMFPAERDTYVSVEFSLFLFFFRIDIAFLDTLYTHS